MCQRAGDAVNTFRAGALPGGGRQQRKKADQSLYGINVGKTTAKGAPIKREVQALYDLEEAGLPMWFVSYAK